MIKLENNVSLKRFNTFGVEAMARHFVVVKTTEQLQEVIHHPIYKQVPHLILGGGSNILFTKDYDGLVIKSEIAGIIPLSETSEHVIVQIGSGEPWDSVVDHAVRKQWGGIENLSLIPGTAGAAPIQNIGAYGVEIKQVIESVDVVDLKEGTKRTVSNADCQFGYRESAFKSTWIEKYFISSITLRLTKKNHFLNTQYGAIKAVLEQHKVIQPTLSDIRDAVISIRRSKLPDPAALGNAGSFFKNPVIPSQLLEQIKSEFPSVPSYNSDNQYVKIPAGWLIEQCGWKGKKINHVGVHDQQALVIVNYGGGNGEEILQLATKISSSVKEKFNIELTREVNVI